MEDAELMDLLEEVIDSAETVRRRYLRAERLAGTKEMKRLFRLLAAEQARHQRLLNDAYRVVRRDHGKSLMQSDRSQPDSPQDSGEVDDHQTEQ